jgi:TldD protein
MAMELRNLVERAKADFIDVRHEVKREAKIAFSGRELKVIGENVTDGYVVRVLNNGGMASLTANDPDDLHLAVKRATEAATIVGRKLKKPIEMAEVPAKKRKVLAKLDGDPRKVSLDDKLELTRDYNSLLLGRPGVSTTEIAYLEVHRLKRYVSSEGADVSEELLTTRISGGVVAKRGGMVQNVRVSVGGSTGMRRLRGREAVFLDKARIVKQLLDAKHVKGGRYTVLLNNGMTGVFTHEAFGHFSEADGLEHNRTFRRKMRIGAKLGTEHVTIIADSTIPGDLGFYRYDDEGVATRPVTLLDEGVLAGRLHSRRTAASFGEAVTGHCIAEDHGHAPIVRMGTIFIKPGERKLDELMSEVRNGLYLCDAKGGQTTGDSFTFGTQYGYELKNGETGKMVRNTNVLGNLFTTLASITAAGSDFKLSEIGGCGKGAQTNIKSVHGGPHIIIEDMVVGGV